MVWFHTSGFPTYKRLEIGEQNMVNWIAEPWQNEQKDSNIDN